MDSVGSDFLSNSVTGRFITLEGIEGVGKSTSLEFIQSYLEQQDLKLVLTREPGGTPIAESIRRVLLTHHDEKIFSDTELLLFFAGRAQHIASVIKPALNKGKWVICDRFTDASYAYQAGGRGIPAERIEILENWVQGDLRPDCVILLDAPVDIALERARARGNPDRFELEKHEFFTRVRECYLERAAAHPERYRIVDASVEREQVQEQIQQVLSQLVKAPA